ncbi:MAG: S8 family serine peptidase, partial [Verrucomicrobiota bacterium]
AEDAEIDHPLLNTFDNPIVRDFGLEPLMKVGVELNDFTFAELVMNASHGTHVAGIVLDASGGRALLHGIAHGHRQTPKVEEYSQIDWLAQAANSAPDYTAYAALIRERILRDAVRRGKRCGAYIRVTGAGVVNMSYGRDRTFFRNLAQAMQDLYRDYGAAPETVDSYQCPEGVDVCTDLAIDLAAAGAAEFAIAMADNPEVLFVMAAGNEEANNDLLLPTPAYLSRILPNAMTVASVRESDDLSLFSNYGKRSVQLAAPGEDILSTVVGDAKATMSGTSMAAPTVAGVAALVRAQHPELGAGDVRRILEISARPIPTLEDFLDTGGVLDADEALRLAKSWKVGGQRLFPSELARMGRPEAAEPQATPAPAPPAVEPGAEASPTVPRLASEAELSDGSWRITTLAGYGSSWSVVMSRGPSLPKSQVVVLPVGENIPYLTPLIEQGREVTAVAGVEGEMAFVTSSLSQGTRQQALVPFDQTKLREALNQGMAITSLTGWDDEWSFFLTEGTGLQNQRFTLPSGLGQERKNWISELGGQGYRITSLAGAEDDTTASWVVVMSQNSGLGDQVYSDPGPWPNDWISERWNEGYYITSAAGFDAYWVVTMSKGTGYVDQRWYADGEFPVDWIKEVWPANSYTTASDATTSGQ